MFYLFLFSFPIIFSIIGLQYHFFGFILFLVTFFGLYLFNLVDALYNAVRSRTFVPQRTNRWLFISFLIFISIDVYSVVYPDVFGVKAFAVQTSSMSPTVTAGDYLVADINYYQEHDLKNGDIILFRSGYHILTKRVIGMAGDVIEGKENRIYVNGTRLREPYIQHIGRKPSLDNFNRKHRVADFEPVIVPEGKLFVMGDNRDNSFDSRDPDFGWVDVNPIVGRPLYIYFSKNKSRIGNKIE